MSNMGYRPKVYDCTIDGIKSVKGKNLFVLHWKDSKGDGSMPIKVDQPSELILNRMKEIVNGKRDKLYLTRGEILMFCISVIINGNYMMNLIFMNLKWWCETW